MKSQCVAKTEDGEMQKEHNNQQKDRGKDWEKREIEGKRGEKQEKRQRKRMGQKGDRGKE